MDKDTLSIHIVIKDSKKYSIKPNSHWFGKIHVIIIIRYINFINMCFHFIVETKGQWRIWKLQGHNHGIKPDFRSSQRFMSLTGTHIWWDKTTSLHYHCKSMHNKASRIYKRVFRQSSKCPCCSFLSLCYSKYLNSTKIKSSI